KWVLPTLEEELKAVEKRAFTYRDLLDLFDTSVKRFSTRVAMRIERDGRKEQYTYEDVNELTLRAAGFFAAKGIRPGERVILFSNTMPEWGMAYFGILKAGATAIPTDPASSVDEVINFAKAGEAAAIVISPKLVEENSELRERLAEAFDRSADNPVRVSAKHEGSRSSKKTARDTESVAAAGGNADKSVRAPVVWSFDEVFEIETEIEEAKRNALLPSKSPSNTIASLIFTSGTTGTPKAVMLTHKNFVNMVSMLSSVLEMDLTDGVLSVLPMHHTFEFSAGFLTPFSNGT